MIKQISEALDSLDIPYLIGGSLASSTLGKFRYTNDVDFVVDIESDKVSGLVRALHVDYYIDEEMVCSALEHKSEFSVVQFASAMKVDMFIKQTGAWADSVWSRRRLHSFTAPDTHVQVYIPSAEDMILQKLNWYRMGREVSDRQWSDVTGMLEVQSAVLDYAYMEQWAENLDLTDLLHRACDDAGIGSR